MTSIIPIPNRPVVTSLNGTEQIPAVQSGTNVKILISQIASFSRTFSPSGINFGPPTQIVAAYAVQLSDSIILATGAAGVPTFPTAAGFGGLAYIFKNASGSSITPLTTLSQTIDGSSPASLANHGVLRIFSDNANWQSW